MKTSDPYAEAYAQAARAAERCQYHTPTGRQCACLIQDPQSKFCPRHSESPSTHTHNFADLLAEHAENFQTPEGINHSLAALYKLLASGRISTRRATGLAYIASLLLRTLPGIREQIIETTDSSQFVPARGRVGCSDDEKPPIPPQPTWPGEPTTPEEDNPQACLSRQGFASHTHASQKPPAPAPVAQHSLPPAPQPQAPETLSVTLPTPPSNFRACLPWQVYLQSVQPYGPVQSFPHLPSLAFRSSVAPAHHAHGNRVSTPLRPGPYAALMPQTFSSSRHNFDWHFITPGVKPIVLICSGVFLLQTLANILLGEFVDRRDVLSLICEAV